MVGSLFAWKSFWQKRRTTDDLPTADSPAHARRHAQVSVRLQPRLVAPPPAPIPPSISNALQDPGIGQEEAQGLDVDVGGDALAKAESAALPRRTSLTCTGRAGGACAASAIG